MTRLLLIVACLLVHGSGVVLAEKKKGQRSTHPSKYTTVHEVRRDGERTRIASPDKQSDDPAVIEGDPAVIEIDDRSLIAISFDETRMSKPKKDAYQVKIRVEAFQTKDGDRDRIAPIDNYVARRADQEGNPKIANFDRVYFPAKSKHVPDTIIDPDRLSEQDVDQIELRIINRKTRERMVLFFRLREFGWRAKMTDTFMFFNRKGGDPKEGIDAVKFSPAAGVTFGTTYLPRKYSFIRALRPGFGLNASILNWKDRDFDEVTGQVSATTTGSKLNVGLGVQVSLFNNVLIATYGVNLQAARNRHYYGIGISIIQLNGAITEGRK